MQALMQMKKSISQRKNARTMAKVGHTRYRRLRAWRRLRMQSSPGVANLIDDQMTFLIRNVLNHQSSVRHKATGRRYESLL